MIEPENVARWHRNVAAIGNAAAEDPEALAQAEAVLADLANRVRYAGVQLHAEGFSYTELARALGITRQAARDRYYRRQP